MRLFYTFLLLYMTISPQTMASTCKNDVFLQVLGSGGPELDDARTSSSYLIWYKDKAKVLLDTGSGSSIQFGLSGGRFEDLDVILLSHLHTDHSADLPAFVKGSFFTSRQRDMWVLGPTGNQRVPSTTEFIDRLFGPLGAFSYLGDYLEEGKESYVLKSADSIASGQKDFQKRFSWGKVSALDVNHGPIPAIAWKIEIAGCSIVYSGDMSNKQQKLADLASSADLLIAHFAIPEEAGRIAKNLHMPPSKIADIIAKAKPAKLLLSHFMKRSEHKLEKGLNIIEEDYTGPIWLAEEQLKIPVFNNPSDNNPPDNNPPYKEGSD